MCRRLPSPKASLFIWRIGDEVVGCQGQAPVQLNQVKKLNYLGLQNTLVCFNEWSDESVDLVKQLAWLNEEVNPVAGPSPKSQPG